MPVITWMLFLEIAYFIVLLIVGLFLGHFVKKRMTAKMEEAPSIRDERVYRLLSVLFVFISLFYLIFGYIPGWIGRNIIFFAGYYWGMAGKRKG